MLDITPAQQGLILDLLQLRLPHVNALAFGSRVAGWPFGRGPKPYSDLTLRCGGCAQRTPPPWRICVPTWKKVRCPGA